MAEVGHEQLRFLVAFRIVVRAHTPVGSDLIGSVAAAAVGVGSGVGCGSAGSDGGTASTCPSGVAVGAGAGFKSLKDTWADTTTAHGKLMVTILGGLAEFERELIRARTGEGRKRAMDRGVKFGRPKKLTPHQREEALQRLAAGETQSDVARTFNIAASTISRLAASSPFEQSAVGQ